MGYISVLIALIAGAAKGFMGKKISGSVTTHRQSVFVNIIRMIICSLISILFFAFDAAKSTLILDVEALIYGMLAGISMSVFIVTWLLAIRHGAFMLISVAQMFGVVITLLCSFVVFRETILPRQVLAIGLLITAVLIMASYSTTIKGRLGGGAVILLVLCGFSSGIYDFSLKLFTHFSRSSIPTLNLITYVISAISLALLFAIPSQTDRFDTKKLFKQTIISMLIMAVCLFVNSYFKAMANDYLPATQIYPMYQAGGLILSALMSAVFFKEKITLRCVLGLVLAFISILLLK